jgi:DNA topoisomerase-2
MEKKYKKHQLRDHIYEIPGTYIGSIENTTLDTYVYSDETKKFSIQNITYVPGLYKIYDEIVVNALDQITRLKQEEAKKELENIRHVKTIKFTIDKKSGIIEIENDGDGIDIDVLPAGFA